VDESQLLRQEDVPSLRKDGGAGNAASTTLSGTSTSTRLGGAAVRGRGIDAALGLPGGSASGGNDASAKVGTAVPCCLFVCVYVCMYVCMYV
jgi:hypothetical protein